MNFALVLFYLFGTVLVASSLAVIGVLMMEPFASMPVINIWFGK